MSHEEPTIEAEVVEIDGISIQSEIPHQERSRGSSEPHSAWRSWQGKVKAVDARWWPLWLILGFLLLIIVVAIGMCAAVIGFIYWICKSLIRGLAAMVFPPSQLPR